MKGSSAKCKTLNLMFRIPTCTAKFDNIFAVKVSGRHWETLMCGYPRSTWDQIHNVNKNHQIFKVSGTDRGFSKENFII